jgi:hypothetical protein
VPAVIVFVGNCYNRSCSFMIHLGLQFSWISLFRAKVLGQERRMAMRSSTLAFEELQEHRIVMWHFWVEDFQFTSSSVIRFNLFHQRENHNCGWISCKKVSIQKRSLHK